MTSCPLRVLELRTVRGTGGGPDKTILQGTALADRSKYHVVVCYVRDARDDVYNIDKRARQLGLDYVEVVERHSLDWRVWPALRRVVREHEIELIHSHDYKTNALALLVAKAEGVTAVATAHGWVGKGEKELRLYYPLDRRMQRHFAHVVAVSSDIKADIVRCGGDPTRVTVVLNGVDPRRFQRDTTREAESRRHFGFPRDAVVVGAVGRLEPEKNFSMLIRAVARVRQRFPQVFLALAGDGSLRRQLEQEAATAGLADRSRFLGLIADVPLLHHALDVYVQSSDEEGTSNAVLEAMALETPVVATDVGGTAEVARHGLEALIVPRQDEDAIVAGILDLLGDPTAARARAMAARRRVETDLSFELRTRRLESIYDAVMARVGRHPQPVAERA